MTTYCMFSSPFRTDGTSSGPVVSRDQERETFWFSPLIRLGGAFGSSPARRVEDPCPNPGSGENFSLKLTT